MTPVLPSFTGFVLRALPRGPTSRKACTKPGQPSPHRLRKVVANPNPTIQSTPKSLLELPSSLSGLLNRTGQIFGTLIPYNTTTTGG